MHVQVQLCILACGLLRSHYTLKQECSAIREKAGCYCAYITKLVRESPNQQWVILGKTCQLFPFSRIFSKLEMGISDLQKFY